MLNAFHKETDGDTGGNSIQTIFVTIPVIIKHKLRIENTHVADCADCFVFRSIDTNRETGMWACGQLKFFHTLGTGKVTAVIATIRQFFTEVFIQKNPGEKLGWIGALPDLVIIDGEEMEFVHIFGKSGRAPGTQIELGWIIFGNYIL